MKSWPKEDTSRAKLSRSHTRRGPGRMPFRRTAVTSPRVCRGPGSLDAEAYCYRLASQGRFTEAIAAANLHNRMVQKSPIRISSFVLGKWAEYAQEAA